MGAQTKKLETQIWYRIFKVIYIFYVILSVGFISSLAYSSLPQKVIDYNKSYIQCNGVKKIYYISSENDLFYSFPPFQLTELGLTFVKSGCLKYQRMKQNLPPLTEDEVIQLKAEDVPLNYTVILKYKYDFEDWKNWLGYTISAYVGVLIVSIIIKKTFLYIVIGKK